MSVFDHNISQDHKAVRPSGIDFRAHGDGLGDFLMMRVLSPPSLASNPDVISTF